MKKLIISCLLIIICCSCSVHKNNPYEININNFEVKNINGEEVLYLKPNTVKYNETYKNKTINREIVKVNIYDLNANTVQKAINGPLYKDCYAIIFIPSYITTTTIFKYKASEMTISGSKIKELYLAIQSNSVNRKRKAARTIFNCANKNASNYILYGKDINGKNVGYVYRKGKENIGIVFFYPDDFSPLLDNMWKKCLDLGWENTINNFISLMEKYNPHLNIEIKTHNNTRYLYLTYK